MFSPIKIRQDFPIFSRKKGKPLIYLDNAATTQKPVSVLAAMENYYMNYNANVHRSVYKLAQESTEIYEKARKNIAEFIGAKPDEIIFTKNATESLNLVSYVVSETMNENSKILLTQMEHHSNVVPWQLCAKRKKLRLAYVKIKDGKLDLEDVKSKLEENPTIFSFTHVSNVLGAVNDVKFLTKLAKKHGTLVCLDAAQSAPHMKINVKELGCDFLAFSSHKMLGPTGIGVLYMKRELQEKLVPFLGGGDMIKTVDFEVSIWNLPPHKYEAGTPNMAGAVGLSAAIDYIKNIGIDLITNHSKKMSKLCREMIEENIKDVKIFGTSEMGIVSFNIGKIHAHDIATFADREGIAIRAGHHCAQPLIKVLGQAATARASFYIYNYEEEIKYLVDALKKAKNKLG